MKRNAFELNFIFAIWQNEKLEPPQIADYNLANMWNVGFRECERCEFRDWFCVY